MRRRTITLLGISACAAIAALTWRAATSATPRPAASTDALIAALNGPTSRPALLELERRAIRGDRPRKEMAAILRAVWLPNVLARRAVRAGESLPIAWSVGRAERTRWEENWTDRVPAAGVTWGAEARLFAIRLGDANLAHPRRPPFKGYVTPLPNGGGDSQVLALPAGVAVGPTVARFVFEFRYLGGASKAAMLDLRSAASIESVSPERNAVPPFAIAWDAVIDVPLTILPADAEDDVARVVDPSLRAAMAASVVPRSTDAFGAVDGAGAFPRPRRGTSRLIHDLGSIQFVAPPVAIAADLWARNPKTGAEAKLQSFAVRAGRTFGTNLAVPQASSAVLADAESVDLILRPSAAAARRSIDVTEMWAEPIELKSVPLRFDDNPIAATLPATTGAGR